MLFRTRRYDWSSDDDVVKSVELKFAFEVFIRSAENGMVTSRTASACRCPPRSCDCCARAQQRRCLPTRVHDGAWRSERVS